MDFGLLPTIGGLLHEPAASDSPHYRLDWVYLGVLKKTGVYGADNSWKIF